MDYRYKAKLKVVGRKNCFRDLTCDIERTYHRRPDSDPFLTLFYLYSCWLGFLHVYLCCPSLRVSCKHIQLPLILSERYTHSACTTGVCCISLVGSHTQKILKQDPMLASL